MKASTLFRAILPGLLGCALLSLTFSSARADGLDNWTLRNPRFTASLLNDVAFGGGTYVAVGYEGTVLASPNGTDWGVQNLDPALHFRAITHGNGRFVALSQSGSLLTSLNGTNWISRFDSGSFQLSDVTFGNGLFAAIGYYGEIFYSTDALIWSNRVVALPGFPYSITYGNGLFVAVGGGARAWVSSDLSFWISVPMPGSSFYTYQAVTRGNNLFVAVGDAGQIATSTNGTNWASQSSGVFESLGSITYGNGRFVALSRHSSVACSSTNGTNWVVQETTEPYGLNGVAHGNGGFVAVGNVGAVVVAADPLLPNAWTNRSSVTSAFLMGVAHGNGTFVAVGDLGTVVTSAGGTLWAAQSSGTNLNLTGVAFGAGRFVAVGYNGLALRSPNGTNWASLTIDPNTAFTDVAYGGGQFLAAGEEHNPSSGASVGIAYTSPDGANWTRRTLPTVAIPNGLAYGNGQFVATTPSDGGGSAALLLSSPDGVTWHCANVPVPNSLAGIAFGNGQFLALDGGGEKALASLDGENWLTVNTTNSSQFQPFALASGGGAFVAVGYGESNAVSSSSSGIAWTNRATPPGVLGYLASVAYGGGTFVAVGYGGIIIQSGAVSNAPAQPPVVIQQPQSLLVNAGDSAGFIIGVTGTQPLRYQWKRNGLALPGATNSLLILSNALPANNGLYTVSVTNAFGGTISAPAALTVIEPDPLDHWFSRQSGLSPENNANLNSVAFGNGIFVAIGSGSVFLTSPDGANWLRHLPPQPFNGQNVVFGAGTFLANESSDDNHNVFCPAELTSFNGTIWTNPVPPLLDIYQQPCLPSIKSVAYGGGRFVAIGYGFILVSTNAINWSYAIGGFELDFQSVAYGNGRFVVVGGGDGNPLVLLSSADGLGWTYGASDAAEASGNLRHVAFGNGLFVATGLDGRVLTSPDGLYWQSSFLSFMGRLGPIAFGGGRFAAMPAEESGNTGFIFDSADGMLWFSRYLEALAENGGTFRSMTYGHDTFVAVGTGGLIYQSDPLANTAPMIVQQPRNVTVQPGYFAQLSVGVLGSSALTYEWFKNGISLCQGSLPYLYLEPVNPSDAGDYYVVVRNRFGSATSATARLTVNLGQPQLIIQDMGIARLTILGPGGYRYTIQCADDAGGTNEWRILTTIENAHPPFIWYDVESPIVPARFYRVMVE